MKDKYKNIDDIKLLKKSNLYMEALSQGINPFTGEYFDDSLLQNIKLQSCFDYISDVLADIIEMCINEKSAEVGIKDINREAYNGRKYKQIVYSTEAQKFVVEKLLDSDLNNQGSY